MVNKLLLNPGAYKGTYKLIGGSLCLNFSNTISFRNRSNPHDWLDSNENLVSWCEITQILNESEIKHLLEELNLENEQNEAKWNFLKEFREVIYRVFSAISDLEPPNLKDLAYINNLGKQKISWQEIQFRENKFQICTSNELSLFEKIINVIYSSTIKTLTQLETRRIKKCKACQWLFYDSSKNLSRKWCVMEDCGNRDKVNRFNKRKLNKKK